jgi:hypothetical protein
MPTEVFLSHSRKDAAAADKLANVLRNHGVPVFYSPTNILGAQQWHDEIGSALKRTDWFVLLLSPHAVQSRWVKHELMYALNTDRFHERIVPLRLKKCDHEKLSWTLASYQFIDFSKDFDTGCRELLRVWGIGLKV